MENFGLGYLISPFVVAVGWFIVARQADVRERRKDIKELVKDLDEKLRSALELWIKYYSSLPSSSESLAAAAQLKAVLQEIPLMIDRLNTAGLFLSIDDNYLALRKFLAGYDFESMSRITTTIDHNRYVLSCMLVSEIVSGAEKSYFDSYPVRRIKFMNWDLFFSALRK